MDKFIKDKINDLEVKDNFDSINSNIEYSNFTNQKKSSNISKLLKRLIIPFGTLVSILIIVVVLSFSLGDSSEKYRIYQAKEKVQTSSFYGDENYKIFIDKIENFSNELTVKIYDRYKDEIDLAKQNYCISPISVYMGLAMAVESSNGNTRKQILDAVGVTYEEVMKFTSYLYSMSNSSSNGLFEGGNLYMKKLANSIWLDKDVEFIPEGLENLSKLYHADSYHVPFSKRPNAASRAVNDYINKMTEGMIDPNLEYSPETLFILINTFYLKDVWNYDGDKLPLTNEIYHFTQYDNTKVDTNLMIGHYLYGDIYEGANYFHFFTATNHNHKLKFIIPKDGYSIDDIYNIDNLNEVNSCKYLVDDYENMVSYRTRCLFPEFNAEFNQDIKDVLIGDFGIIDMFINGDFSNITDQKIICEAVHHQTKIEVNRRGIEGGAAVIIPGAGAAGPGELEIVYQDFVVDRAFIFLLTDSSDNVLFSGAVGNI